MAEDAEARAPGILDRALRVFGDVRPGEAGTVVLMAANIFLLLVGYYVIKTVREPLILATGGAELKAYASAAQAVTLMGFVPLYGWIASRLPRLRLIGAVIVFFIACIELFFLAGQAEVRFVGFVFYVWVGIFSLATIAQFWSFANDIYRREDGERLFPLIAVGMTAGGPVGAWVAGRLFHAGVGPYSMLQITAALLAVHLVIYRVVHHRVEAAEREASSPAERLAAGDAFAMVLRSPYLRLVALLIVVLNVVNTTGEYMLGRTVVEAAEADLRVTGMVGHTAEMAKQSFIGGFYGDFNFGVSLATILIQALLVSRLVRLFGFAGVLLTLPLVALGSYGLIGAGAGFAVLRWTKTAENATDYSVMNTARQMLWLPTSREEKYKGKQAIDTFFVRLGDLVQAGLVWVGTEVVVLGVRGFALVNLGLIAVWLVLAVLLLRSYRGLCTGCE